MSHTYEELFRRGEALLPRLRERAPRCEELRRMPDETLRDFHDTGLFRFQQPKRVGGSELDFYAAVTFGALVGRACASSAWNLVNLGTHHMLLGMFPPNAQDDVWNASRDALIASSFVFPAGKARKVQDGYVISGRWPFSSGVDPSDWLMLAANVGDAKATDPEQRFFLVPRRDWTEIDNWHAMGLAGTGSKDVAVDHVFVPEHLSLGAALGKGGPHPGSAANTGALYKLAWYALFGFVNGATALGIAQGAVEEFTQATRARLATASGRHLADFATMQLRVAEAATLVDAAETLMLKDCDEAMAIAEAGRLASEAEKVRWRRDGAFAVQMSVRAVDILFAGAGGSAIVETHPLQRALRDAHAAQGHIGLNWDVNGTMYGRVALGLDPEFPLL